MLDVMTETGRFELETESGSRYLIELADARTLTRIPSDGPGSGLRRDEDAIAIVDAGAVEVGRSAVFWLDLRRDGVITVRQTTPVRSVRRL